MKIKTFDMRLWLIAGRLAFTHLKSMEKYAISKIEPKVWDSYTKYVILYLKSGFIYSYKNLNKFVKNIKPNKVKEIAMLNVFEDFCLFHSNLDYVGFNKPKLQEETK